MGDAVAFKCKYCQKYYTNKKEFAQHKRDEHADQMSTTASDVSSMRSGAAKSPPKRSTRGTAGSPSGFVKPAPKSKKKLPPRAVTPAESPPVSPPSPPEEEEEEEAASPPASPRRGRPGPKSKTKKQKMPKSNNPLPEPIGKKRKKVVNGVEEEEFIRNPKFNGA